MPLTSELTAAPSEQGLRLPSIERAGSLRVALFAALFRRQLGKVMTPVWVIYARMPRLLWPQILMLRLAQKGLSLDPTLVDLIQIRVSAANGCTFCTDLHRAVAQRSGRDARKLSALDQSVLGRALSEAERIALTFADEIAGQGLPSDGTFAALRAAFSERAIVELVWLCSFTAYLNRMARVLGIASDGFCELGAQSA